MNQRIAKTLALCGFLLMALGLLSASWALVFNAISYANTVFAMQSLTVAGLGGVVLALGMDA